MKALCKKIVAGIKATWRIHIGISSGLVILAAAVLLYHFLLKGFLGHLFGEIKKNYDPNSLVHAIGTGIVSGILSAVAFGLIGVFVLGWYSKFRLTGKYNAFTVDNDGEEQPWGEVEIRYHPLSDDSHHMSVKLFLQFNDIKLEGDGLIIDNRYLIGHYYEVENTERRRSGAFMYILDGTGTTWSGDYIHIDPDNDRPATDKAVWRRSD